MNIYQIKQEFLTIFDELEMNGGELTPELEEQLNITQETFKEKIEAYTNVIKLLNNDIEAIKVEQKRLKDLADKKEKTINKLKAIIVESVEQFGDTKKSGVKYLDYGTGQVSIRNSTVVDVDNNVIKKVGKAIAGLTIYNKVINQLDVADRLYVDSIIDYVKTPTTDAENNIIEGGYTVNEDDLRHTNLELSVKIPVSELLDGKAYPIIKEIAKHTDYFNATASVSKTDLKKELEENGACTPNIAHLVINKSIIIK